MNVSTVFFFLFLLLFDAILYQCATPRLLLAHCQNIGEDFGPKQIISGFVVWPWSVIGADLDGDGDNGKYRHSWCAAISTTQLCTIHSLASLTSSFLSLQPPFFGADVISASSFDNKISWYENSDFRGNFGNQRLVSSNTVGARAIRAADIDGDGDLDIVSASYVGDFVGHLNGVGTSRLIWKRGGWYF